MTYPPEFFRKLFDEFPSPIWRAGLDAKCDYFNRSWLMFTGRTLEQELGDGWAGGVHPDDRDRCVTAYLAAFHARHSFELEYRLRRYDGVYRWMVDIGQPFDDLDGHFAGYLGACYDITDRKQAEEALMATTTLLETTFGGMRDAVLVVDPRTRVIVKCNQATTRIFGYTEGEIVGRTTEVLHVDRARFEEYGRHLFPALDAHGVFHTEFSMRRKDGSIFVSEQTVSEIRTEAGERTLVVNVLRDVTERVTMEAQLRQSQKMHAVGQLAGGIAHDFNNLLTVIFGYSEWLLSRGNLDASGRNKLTQIHQAGQRAAGLTRQLLTFSRQQILQPQILDLNKILSDMEELLRRLIGENIMLVTKPGCGIGHVKADPGQVEQIIMNLAINARDAMLQGGQLTLETAEVELDDAHLRRHGSAIQPGHYALLVVSDTGCGMDAPTQSRIFEPFFTTKPQGTGLGLSTVYGIVEQSGGLISVDSEVGRGTTFKTYLPLAEERGASNVAGSAPVVTSPGTEVILLVEDEDLVRGFAYEVMQSRGYQVLEARDAEEALRLDQSHSGPIHLLVTDVVMPGMSGPQLAKQLTTRRPEMKVLFLSGYTDSTVVLQGVEENTLAFLQKPYAELDLVRKIREVLEAPPREWPVQIELDLSS